MRCQLKDACLGGVESPCSEDYEGLRCGECSEGRYLWGGSCSPCGAYSVVIVLFVILIVLAVIVLLFSLWQVLLNPLVGSPFIFAMRLAETLAILGQSSLKWPSQVSSRLRYTRPAGLSAAFSRYAFTSAFDFRSKICFPSLRS